MNSRSIAPITLVFAFVLAAFQTLFAATPEFGKAAYYNDKFHGRKTASGELYDKDALTASHKTLKFGTIVRVTRLDNGMSVEVRINDRGPFKDGYVTDLSRKAAEQIDLVKAGIAQVKLEVVEAEVVAPKAAVLKEVPAAKPAASTNTAVPTMPDLVRPASYSKPTPAPATEAPGKTLSARNADLATPQAAPKVTAPAPPPIDPALYQLELRKVAMAGFGVQLASYSSAEVALDELAKLQQNLPGKVLLKLGSNDKGQPQYKILLGPYADKKAADVERKAAAKKHPKCFVVDLAN